MVLMRNIRVSMTQPITLFTSVYPYNLFQRTHKKTLEEIKYLSNIEEDREFVKEHDKVSKVFGKLHEELGLEFNKDEAKKYNRESAKYIMELKYKYQDQDRIR